MNARYKFLGEFANDTVVNSTYPAWQELAFWRLYMPLNGSEAGRLVGGPLLFDLLQSVDATVAAVQSGATVGGEGWGGVAVVKVVVVVCVGCMHVCWCGCVGWGGAGRGWELGWGAGRRAWSKHQ